MNSNILSILKQLTIIVNFSCQIFATENSIKSTPISEIFLFCYLGNIDAYTDEFLQFSFTRSVTFDTLSEKRLLT